MSSKREVLSSGIKADSREFSGLIIVSLEQPPIADAPKANRVVRPGLRGRISRAEASLGSLLTGRTTGHSMQRICGHSTFRWRNRNAEAIQFSISPCRGLDFFVANVSEKSFLYRNQGSFQPCCSSRCSRSPRGSIGLEHRATLLLTSVGKFVIIVLMFTGNPKDSKDSLGKPPAPESLPEGDRSSFGRRALIYFATAAIIFLLGFVPMWLKARERARQNDQVRGQLEQQSQQLRKNDLLIALANAALDARRGEYESARMAAASFFTTLNAETTSPTGILTAAQREAVQTLLAQRDDLITLLARSDPAAAERLSAVYVAFRKIRESQ